MIYFVGHENISAVCFHQSMPERSFFIITILSGCIGEFLNDTSSNRLLITLAVQGTLIQEPFSIIQVVEDQPDHSARCKVNQ
jgi:hypothetical protein